ncbi:MAG: helix-turn-helix domain-containing protein [Sphingobacterium sp.]
MDNQKINVVYQEVICAKVSCLSDSSLAIVIIDRCSHGECIAENKVYALNSKQLFIYYPSGEYKWNLPAGASGRTLILDGSVLWGFSKLKQNFSFRHHCETILLNDEIYHKLSADFNAIQSEISSEVIFPELIDARARLMALMINLLLEEKYGLSGQSVQNDIGFRFLALVEQHYKMEKRVAFYAEQLCITPNYLGTICRKQYRVSPLEVIYQKIISEAKKLLSRSTYTIKEISFELGFRSFSHFTYFFRRYTGVTPGAFRSTL